MNTTSEQFRIAADILEKGLQWQENWNGVFIDADGEGELWECLRCEREIRIKPLSFPPIPEGMTLHNPDGLTAEQVGDGWRLTVPNESVQIPDKSEVWHKNGSIWKRRPTEHIGHRYSDNNTYRVPISTPFPDGSYLKDGKLVKPFVPKFKVGDRVRHVVRGEAKSIFYIKSVPVSEGYAYTCEYSPGGFCEQIREENLEVYPPQFAIGQRVKSSNWCGTVEQFDPHSNSFKVQWDSVTRWELEKELSPA